jgi:hypothetical protein
MMGRLLAMRLRWYSEATALVLLRRWQIILLLIGTLVPVGGSLLGVASYPVLVLLDPGHGVSWRLFVIGLWQGCWMLWALMQQDQLRGGPFARYLQSLPIPASSRRRLDSVVLLVGNTPLLIPFLAAGIALGMPCVAAADAVRGALLIAFLLATQWCAQHAVLDGRGRAWTALLAVDLWTAFLLGMPAEWTIALMVPTVAISIRALLTDVPAPPRGLSLIMVGLTVWGRRRLGGAVRILPPGDRLALGILYGQNRPATLGTFFCCLLVTFAAHGLMSVWDFDGRCLPLVLIAFGVLALAISGLYQPLQLAHEAAHPYMAALPLRTWWWIRVDTTAVMGFALPFAIVLAASLRIDAGVSGRIAVAAVASFLLLVALLRVPQRFSRRHAVVTSTLLSAGWTFAAANLLIARTP